MAPRFSAHLQQLPRTFHAALGPFAGQAIEFGASEGAVNEPQPEEKHASNMDLH